MSPSNTAPPVDVERFVRLTDVPLDEAYALLANPRARLTLHVLSACEPPLSVAGLAAAIADREDDERTVRASLVHAVLPKLEAVDVLEYDADTGLIRLEQPVVAAADPIADRSASLERRGSNAPP